MSRGTPTDNWRFSNFSSGLLSQQPSKPPQEVKKDAPEKRGWRVREWYPEVGISRAWTWRLIKEEKIKTVKLGKARIITTSPSEFLARLAERGTR